MADQETFPIPDEIKKSIELQHKLSDIDVKIKGKKHELEKAFNEISFVDKDSRYATMLYQQKNRSEQNYSTQLNILDEKLESELIRIANLREEIEKRYEKQKFHLDCEEKTVRDKIALKRQKIETEGKDKQRYFEDEIQRINSEKKSNPKTRGLELDLVALEKEKAELQIEVYGYPISICYEPYFPESERDRLLKIKKDWDDQQIVLKEQEKIKKERELKIKEARLAEEKVKEQERQEKEKERQLRVREEQENGGFFATWSSKNEQMKNFPKITNIVMDTKKRQAKVVPK